jgi:hypothetical protein
MTSIERTAYPQFRRLTSARVLHVFFTPAAEEIAWAQERTARAGRAVRAGDVADGPDPPFGRLVSRWWCRFLAGR